LRLHRFKLTVIPCFATQLAKQGYYTTQYLRNDCFATRLYLLQFYFKTHYSSIISTDFKVSLGSLQGFYVLLSIVVALQ
jgi:hypothetical protein